MILFHFWILVATHLLSLQIKQVLTFDDTFFEKFSNQLNVVKVVGLVKEWDIVIGIVCLVTFFDKILKETLDFSDKHCKHKLEKFGTYEF